MDIVGNNKVQLLFLTLQHVRNLQLTSRSTICAAYSTNWNYIFVIVVVLIRLGSHA
ncbi:hypothetical protein IC582_017176 [Cucumis melo]